MTTRAQSPSFAQAWTIPCVISVDNTALILVFYMVIISPDSWTSDSVWLIVRVLTSSLSTRVTTRFRVYWSLSCSGKATPQISFEIMKKIDLFSSPFEIGEVTLSDQSKFVKMGSVNFHTMTMLFYLTICVWKYLLSVIYMKKFCICFLSLICLFIVLYTVYLLYICEREKKGD